MAPRKAYLEFVAQPAMMTPYTPIEVSDKRYSSPASALETTTSGDSGMTAQAAKAGMSAITGARRNRILFDLAGMITSFISSLNTSAKGCPSPGNRPEQAHAVRAAPQLHPADDLALPQSQQRHTDDERHRDDEDPERGVRVVGERCPDAVDGFQHFASGPASRSRPACGLHGCAAARARGAPAHRSGTAARPQARRPPGRHSWPRPRACPGSRPA